MSDKPQKRQPWGDGRAKFSALAPQILAELKRGYSRRRVYEQFKDRLGICYSRFNKLVRAHEETVGQAEFIPKVPCAPRSAPPASEASARSSEAPPMEKKPLTEQPRGFHFDPTDISKKKLI